MDNLKKEESDFSQIIIPTKNRYSISNEASDSSKLMLKNYNYTEIVSGKNKNISKYRNSKFKLDQSKIDKVQTYKKHLSKPNVYSAVRHLQKINHISNIKSPNRKSSFKTLEKDIRY